jgi:hypothetical protein
MERLVGKISPLSPFFSLLAAFEAVCTTFLAFFRKYAPSQAMSLAGRVSLIFQCGVVFKFGDGFPLNSANAAILTFHNSLSIVLEIRGTP